MTECWYFCQQLTKQGFCLIYIVGSSTNYHLMNAHEFLQLSYRELSKKTGIDKKNWHEYFHNNVSPTISSLTKIASKLDMPRDELINAIELKQKEILRKSISS